MLACCIVGLSLFLGLAKAQCPPAGFDSVGPTFNLTRYISAPWYVQMQQPLSYQPESQLYCVRAEYIPLGESLEDGLRVNNYANDGAVNGPVVGSTGGGTASITARIPDPADPSKLSVGFSLGGFQLGSGPYWVVAIDEDNYDWAIITGGPPTVQGTDGCQTGGGGGGGLFGGGGQVNNIGFWLFSRRPVDPENTEVMLSKASQLGLDLSVLRDVQQMGCLYEGA
jgi:lipocalin